MKEDKSCVETSYQTLAKVLDSLDAIVYVADLESYELLFINHYGKKLFGDVVGKTCWQALQTDQEGPCSFCTNARLLDEKGIPTKPYVWEFQNTITGNWYQCRDQAIEWIDGRLVRLEIATDITERKEAEAILDEARKNAEKLARIDGLTGLLNRRAFFEEGTRLLAGSKRFTQALSLALLDVDYFKQINDTYSHAAGDSVLKGMAEIIEETLREIDVVARIGGEEFAIILPQTNLEQSMQVVQRLRTAIDEKVFEFEGKRMHITVSIGLLAAERHEQTVDILLRKADDLLYQAKRYGRNRVEYRKACC